MVLTVGAGAAFALDAATFLVSAELLRHIRPRARGEAPQERTTVIADLRAGWQEVRSRTWVWATIAAFTVVVLCAYAQWVALAPVISRDVYGSAAIFGLLVSVAGGGAVLGALIGIRWRPRRPLLAGLALTLVWPVEMIALAGAAPLAAVLVLGVAGGLGFSLFEVWWQTALVRHVPPHALSRVASYDWMGSLALLPLGFALAGPLAGMIGARTALGVGAGVALVTLILAMTPRATRCLTDGDGDGNGDDDDDDSAEQLDDDVAEELGREAEVAHVDALV
jgi:predicted MFS family arabinose efflux permease